MRSPLSKKIIASFKREFESRFSHFSIGDTQPLWWRWDWKIAPMLTFFMILQAFERKDQFVLEVAWSENGEFPWRSVGRLDIEQPEGRDRLGRLWTRGEEPVWDLAPEATEAIKEDIEALARGESAKYIPDPPIKQLLPRIDPLVQDAINKFEQYGMPFFQKVAQKRDILWPH
jgi:hypothetical protein